MSGQSAGLLCRFEHSDVFSEAVWHFILVAEMRLTEAKVGADVGQDDGDWAKYEAD